MPDFKFEHQFLMACSTLERDAATKIGRDLLPAERAAIRNAGTVRRLEPTALTVLSSMPPADLAQHLAEAGAALEQRRSDYCAEAVDLVQGMMNRALTNEERSCIVATPYVTEVMTLMIALETTPEREGVLAEFCGNRKSS